MEKRHAFPLAVTTETTNGNYGLTQREYFAARAMQGILATQTKDLIEADMWLSPRQIATSAVDHADALIAALNADEAPQRVNAIYTTNEDR